MKAKLITLIAAMMLSVSLFSQSFILNEYEKIDDIEIDWSSATMEGDDGSIFIFVNLEGSNRIMKMTEKGEIIESKYIEFRDGRDAHRGYHPFFRHPYQENTNVYVYVTHKEGSVPTYNAVFFDNDLNIIENVSAPLYSSKDYSYSEYESYLLDSENNIIVRIGDGSDNTFLFVKMDIYGKILNEREVVIETGDPILSIPYHPLCVYNEEPLQYGFAFLTHTNGVDVPKLTVVVLDSNFNIIEIKEDLIDDDGLGSSYRNNIAGLDDDSYVISTHQFGFENGDMINSVVLSKLDKEHNLINSFEYSQITNYPYYFHPTIPYKNIITTDDGIYWIYALDEIVYDVMGGCLYISYFDKDLNLKWRQRLYELRGGAPYADIQSATVRSNGDLLVSMVAFCQQPVGNEQTLVTILINNEGGILDITENTSSIKPFYLHPNPASEMINVSFAQDVNCENVEIYSLDGRLCHSQNFNFNNINIENLSSGIYMMKITLNNGQTYTEKVVVR